MKWQLCVGIGLAMWAAGLTMASAAVEYIPLDAPAGMSQAVVVEGLPLVHTRQLFPVGRDGKVVGEGAIDKQVDQLLANLDAVLKDAGSGLDKLVRLNVYALAPETVDLVRQRLSKRLPAGVRPAITAILTPLAQRKSLVAADAVATSEDKGTSVALRRCEAVAGSKDVADAAVMPRGGVAYLSGVPEEGGLTASAVSRSIATLFRTLGQLKLSPAHVVQLRVFLKPAVAADDVLKELQQLFPGHRVPPVTFIEWIAGIPVEIELIAALPLEGKPASGVEYYNPPDTRPLSTFSRVALVRTERQIYISGLFGRTAADGSEQARDIFEQLQTILAKTGSDMQHLVKASYYVTDDEGGRALDRIRPNFFDPQRPPAASKVMIYGVGMARRTLTLDMIAVGSGR